MSNPGRDRPLRIRLERLFELGREGDSAMAFFGIREDGVAFDSRGTLYVLDSGNHRVLAYDSTGRRIGAFGRYGAGPGEFRLPIALTTLSADTFAVLDIGRSIIALIDVAGGVVTERRVPGSVLDGPIRYHQGSWTYSRNSYVECGIDLSLPPIFSPYPKWDARGDRVVLAASEYYEIQVFDRGREVHRVRRDIKPARATMAMVEAEYGEGEKWSIGGARSCTVPTRVAVEARGVAEYVPVIRKLALTPADGGLWVQRTSPEVPKGLIDVFDRDGRYVGTLPPNTP